jgi:membrane protease YdiL (CAAX protease family)
VAIILLYIASTALVFGVALARARHATDVQDQAAEFAISATGIMAGAFLSASVLTMVSLVWARFETRDLCRRLRLTPTRASPAGVFAAVFGMAGLSLVSGGLTDLLGLGGRGTMGAVARALERATSGQLAIAVLTIAIAPGIAEEIFFRGLIQAQLAARWRTWPAIVVSAIGFGFIHLDFVQGSVAFVAGLFLGWIAERFGGIRPTMAAHAFNNAAFVVLASFGRADAEPRAGSARAVAVGALMWIGSTALLRSGVALRSEGNSGCK